MTTLRLFWAQARYQFACARGRYSDKGAARCLRAFDAWIAAGMPFRRLLWAALWATHGALYPLRRLRSL